MSQHSGSSGMPAEFTSVLFDEEEEFSDNETVIEEIEDPQLDQAEEALGIDVAGWDQGLNITTGSHVFVRQPDGSLVLENEAQEHDTSLSDSSDDDDDEDYREELEEPLSPVTPPGVNILVPCDASLQPNASGTVRGSPTARRGLNRRGGRGRVQLNGIDRLRTEERSEWTRGMPMSERYATDEELPASLRDSFDRTTSERDRRARATRARIAANLELEEDDSDSEIGLFDTEEFVWLPMDEWYGVKETFLPKTSGPTRRFESAYVSFRSFWDDGLLSHIVTETNRYARGVESLWFIRHWYDTNLDEIMVLFAFWMMLGIHKMPTIKSCFTTLPILRTEIFRTLFAESRYWNLNRAFNLAEGSRDANDPDNVLHPMGPVLDELNRKFKQNYALHQDICIDESLTLWKGPGAFKECMRTKSTRFGIKTYQLCESSTGYLWSFLVYIGAGTTNSAMPSSVSTVLKLVQPLLDKGHVLYMDNCFNSPMLARYLKKRRTDCVGILRSFRRNVPAVIQKARLVEGEFVARQAGDVMVIAIHDRKRLTFVSTFHGENQVQKGPKPGRPSHYEFQFIHDYNHGMGGVDRLDQMLEPYLVERKQCTKWSRKLFKRLLNITIQNARILLEKSSKTKVGDLEFRLALVQSIMDNHLKNVPTRHNKPRQKRRSRYSHLPDTRLTGRHFMRRTPVTEEMRAAVKNVKHQGRRQCAWCSATSNRKSRSYYECPDCNVSLCIDCFEPFHTVP